MFTSGALLTESKIGTPFSVALKSAAYETAAIGYNLLENPPHII